METQIEPKKKTFRKKDFVAIQLSQAVLIGMSKFPNAHAIIVLHDRSVWGIKNLQVDKPATPLEENTAEFLAAYDQLTKAQDVNVIAFYAKGRTKPTHGKVMAKIFKARPSALTSEDKDKTLKGKRKKRRVWFGLDERIPFGKYGPSDDGSKDKFKEGLTVSAESVKHGLTMQELIDCCPDYMRWLLEKFGKQFLDDKAMAYYEKR